MARLLALFALGVIAPALSHAQDRARVVPGMPVLLENDCVRVQYHDAAVGETIPMHSHPSYIVYTFAPFRARIRLADGTERTSDRKAGVAYWNAPISHSVENLGSTPIHNLIVEMKPGASCRSEGGAMHSSDAAYSSAADVALIRAERERSNAAIARRDVAGTVADMLPDYRGTWALSVAHRSRDSVSAALARQYADTGMLGYVRTPTTIEVSATGPAAAEYGRWVGRRRRSDGIQETSGSYYATWQRTPDGWRINSEAFVALACKGSASCPPSH